MSRGTCKDALNNRNYNIAANFLSIARENPESIFYGELGMAHTIFKNKVASSIINNSEEFSMYLLHSANVSCVMGAAFGEPNCVRFSFANSQENIIKGWERIAIALGKLG